MTSLIAAAALIGAIGSSVTTAPDAVTEYRWSEDNYEIYSPNVSPVDSDKIVFVRKFHEPDGHEAESFSESFFKKQERQHKKNPRMADPEVTMLERKGKQTKKIDWGWSPTFSPDGSLVAYSRQVSAITGKRALADTLRGNSLWLYDVNKRSTRFLANPPLGYVENPMFNELGTELAYSISDSVNGAWGGAVGLESINLSTNTKSTNVKPGKLHGLYILVSSASWYNGSTVSLLQVPASGGTYMADRYEVRLEGRGIAYSWGVSERSARYAYAVSKGELRICDKGRWFPYNSPKKPVFDDPECSAIFSPAQSIAAFPSRDAILFVDIKSGEVISLWKAKGEIQAVRWAGDKLVAVVTEYKDKYDEIFARDALYVIKPK
jgi:hypothetical protein